MESIIPATVKVPPTIAQTWKEPNRVVWNKLWWTKILNEYIYVQAEGRLVLKNSTTYSCSGKGRHTLVLLEIIILESCKLVLLCQFKPLRSHIYVRLCTKTVFHLNFRGAERGVQREVVRELISSLTLKCAPIFQEVLYKRGQANTYDSPRSIWTLHNCT